MQSYEMKNLLRKAKAKHLLSLLYYCSILILYENEGVAEI